MSKWKLYLGLFVGLLIGAIYMIFNVEFVQKKVFDIKADLVGADRTVVFYAKMTGEPVKSFSDKDTRYNKEPDGSLTVWLGKAKQKVNSNMDYIISDN